jgi:DNA-binding NarL/FixJ family response regulator
MAGDAEGKKKANGSESRRLRVLIVGEHQILAQGIKAALEQHGVEVIGIAPNGERVVSALSLGLPDAVVLCMWTQDGGAGRLAATIRGRSDAAGTPVFHALTPRELEVLGLLVEGASNKDMARRLSIRSNTVRTHVQNLLAKLQVHTRLEAVTVANRHGSVWPQESLFPPTSTPPPETDWAGAPVAITGSGAGE